LTGELAAATEAIVRAFLEGFQYDPFCLSRDTRIELPRRRRCFPDDGLLDIRLVSAGERHAAS
jgi:hypothetical protein